MPGLAASAQGFYDQVRAPLFMVFYASLALVLWESVTIAKLRTLIWPASQSTMLITAMVLFILIGSTIFLLVFRGVDGDPFIEHLLSHLPGGAVGFLIFVNFFVFFLAFFLDFFEIAFIIVPRSEEHTSELQSLRHLVCRLLLEKKKYIIHIHLHNI